MIHKCFKLLMFKNPFQTLNEAIADYNRVTKHDRFNLLELDIVCEDGTVIPGETQEENGCSTDLGQTANTSVVDILPLPRIEGPVHRRKVKSQKSEILSSTPFTKELERSIEEREIKQGSRKTEAKSVKRKLSNVATAKITVSPLGSKDPKKMYTKKSKTSKAVHDCPRCGERYPNPSGEDWIMCSDCNIWWHESYQCLGKHMGKQQQSITQSKDFVPVELNPITPIFSKTAIFTPAVTSERQYKPSIDVTDQTNDRIDVIGREITNENPENSDFSSDNIPLMQIRTFGLVTPTKHDGESSRISALQPLTCNLFYSANEPGPSCSKSQSKSYNSLWEIKPLPTINRPIQNKRKKRNF
ncbi:hypothetical protein RN001_011648 [Aquatica leii]|uniref:Uncharacterized protein n=1 Tax=Aquatica leii TaxID=1421715 RepID=A0AAN7P616_9COLE|nr:hypothetical protein RN001_011648 [Aquatica leii]